jgi:hypothetical protein
MTTQLFAFCIRSIFHPLLVIRYTNYLTILPCAQDIYSAVLSYAIGKVAPALAARITFLSPQKSNQKNAFTRICVLHTSYCEKLPQAGHGRLPVTNRFLVLFIPTGSLNMPLSHKPTRKLFRSSACRVCYSLINKFRYVRELPPFGGSVVSPALQSLLVNRNS